MKLLPQRHWTPHYILDRLRLQLWQRRNPAAPWLVPAAVHFLDRYLRSSDVLFEFGSGRSTRWFARRVARVESFEGDSAWYEKVRADLDRWSMTNVGYHLVSSENLIQTADEAASGLPGGQVDGVLIDGLDRDRCAEWALRTVRSGGVIVIDNVNRYLPCSTRSPESIGPDAKPVSRLWQDFAEAVAEWRSVWWSDGVTDTAIYFKP